MDFSSLTKIVFGIIFIIILYVIIYYALKIMYKDVKGGGRRRAPMKRKSYGIEVLKVEQHNDLKVGSVIPVRNEVTIGRKEDNAITLSDPHVSGHHARLLIKNEILYVEDLNSTNGTLVNGKKINGRVKLFAKDEIEIGTTVLRVLG